MILGYVVRRQDVYKEKINMLGLVLLIISLIDCLFDNFSSVRNVTASNVVLISG